jgi:hypothetical protein
MGPGMKITLQQGIERRLSFIFSELHILSDFVFYFGSFSLPQGVGDQRAFLLFVCVMIGQWGELELFLYFFSAATAFDFKGLRTYERSRGVTWCFWLGDDSWLCAGVGCVGFVWVCALRCLHGWIGLVGLGIEDIRWFLFWFL